MRIGLAFFHGWGLSCHFWQPLAHELAQAMPEQAHVFFDAGYFGEAQQPDWTAAQQWVGIGHSMGWVHALETPPPNGWAGLVSISGFTRFCAQQAGEPGQARRVIERMVRMFERHPNDVLRDFLDRSNLSTLMPSTETPWNEARLTHDLNRLLDVNVNPLLTSQAAPILALAARDDVIVTPELTKQTFESRAHTRLLWQAEGGHALGHVHASNCAQSIKAFLNSIEHGQKPHQP